MNEMKSLELQLRSWKLRQPTARVKQRLFAEPIRQHDRSVWSFPWLAPVAAGLMLVLMVLNPAHHNPVRPGEANPTLPKASSPENAFSMPSNSALAAILAPSSNRFDWTNDGAFFSSNASFLPGKVN